jgi:hypothetical protein
MSGSMAASKRKRSHNSRKRPQFPEVKGKVVERVEVSAGSENCEIGILFQDRTYLAFEIEPVIRITPDFSDWKTKNYKQLKRWRPITSD